MSEEITLAKAQLIPMNGDAPDLDRALEVQFNPVNLKVTLSNTLKASEGGGGAAQFVDKSSSKLAFELLFDTTLDGSDVRLKTREVAERFMAPRETGGDKPEAPERCRFQWGSFQFEGMVDSYGETLDFFAPEGVPLRATLSLSMSEERYQFERDERVATAARAAPEFTPVDPGTPVNTEDGADARLTDLANGNGDLRSCASDGMLSGGGITALAAGLSVGVSASAGFSIGASAKLGTTIPGAFDLGATLDISAPPSAGVGGTAALGLGDTSIDIDTE